MWCLTLTCLTKYRKEENEKMGYKSQGSLTFQVEKILKSKLRIGESKHLDKQFNTKDFKMTSEFIYSYSTFKNYMKHCNYFVKYCKENHQCKTLGQCKEYIGEWLNTRNDLSAYTTKLELSALCKLYGMSAKEIKEQYNYVAPKRVRSNITRSRNECVRDKHFSEERNKELVTFCRCTGLRRHELENLKSNNLILKDGVYYIQVFNGKGGKNRQVQVIPESNEELQIVLKLFEEAKNNDNQKVFTRIHNGCDVHGYRAEYAARAYKLVARSEDELRKCPKVKSEKGYFVNQDMYIMRTDMKNTILDKKAMLFASRQLGHNRIDVIASHYLRGL